MTPEQRAAMELALEALQTGTQQGAAIDDLLRVLEQPAQKVGCEGEDGLLRIHAESDTCDVCKPAQQEPVAWVKSNGELVVRTDYGGRLYYSEQNLYTHPPAQQKPFGYLKLSTAKFVYEVEGTNPMSDKSYLPLYTSPQAREPLTYEEIVKAGDKARQSFRHHQGLIRGQQFVAADDYEWHFARAIEAAHGIGEKK